MLAKEMLSFKHAFGGLAAIIFIIALMAVTSIARAAEDGKVIHVGYQKSGSLFVGSQRRQP